MTHSYVLVETTAIAHRHLGEIAVRRFVHDLIPVLNTVWIDEATHAFDEDFSAAGFGPA